ncbi:MAG: serine/threonine-protein kinase [Deltaproteobacteria bacterium]
MTSVPMPFGVETLDLEGYELEALLGSGGIATVYRARRVIDDERFAIKVIATSLSKTTRDRFELEAQLGLRIQHPDIVRVYDYGETPEVLWIAMELLDGVDLSQLQYDFRFGFRDRLRVIVRVARALQAAHDVQVFHRDVKPSNIFVTDDGGVKLLDFGISKVAGYRLTRTDVTNGTPRYMAPEQILGHRVDARADVFSLAVVAYELLTGQTPWSGDTPMASMMATCSQPPPPFVQAVAQGGLELERDVAVRLHRVLHRALDTERERRHASADAFADEVEAILAGQCTDSDTDLTAPGGSWAGRRFDWAKARAQRALVSESSDLPKERAASDPGVKDPFDEDGAYAHRMWLALLAAFLVAMALVLFQLFFVEGA